jgi:hypothetical protein
MSIRIQFTFEDDIKTLLDRLSKERGVSPSALMATLIAQAESPSRTAVVHGSEGIALDVVTHRLDQLQQEIAQVQAACEACAAELRDMQHGQMQEAQEVERLRVSLAYGFEQLEPMVGIALRPGVQFRPEAPPPKRSWWPLWDWKEG